MIVRMCKNSLRMCKNSLTELDGCETKLARAEIAMLLLSLVAATNTTAADGFPTLGFCWAGRETGFQSGLAAVGHARRAISNFLRSLRVSPSLFLLPPPPHAVSFLLLCPGSHLHHTGRRALPLVRVCTALTHEGGRNRVGFSPAREVIDMHRLRAPWIVDPALFVRVFADAMPPESPGSPDSGIALVCFRMSFIQPSLMFTFRLRPLSLYSSRTHSACFSMM